MKPLLLSSIPEYRALPKVKRKCLKEEARQGEPNFKWGIYGGFGLVCYRLDQLIMSGEVIDTPGVVFVIILLASGILNIYWNWYVINPKIEKLLKQKAEPIK